MCEVLMYNRFKEVDLKIASLTTAATVWNLNQLPHYDQQLHLEQKVKLPDKVRR